MLTRAYSTIALKSLDDETREITGLASTPSVDREGDIVEPMGAVFSLPLPLLYEHNPRQPVGHVLAAKATADGIEFRARLAKIDEPGELQREVDRAWQLVKSKLVRGLSVAILPIKTAYLQATGGINFLEWEWLELSLVAIPANADATIQTIKSLDRRALAATRGYGAAVQLYPRRGDTRDNPTALKNGAVKIIRSV